MVSPIRQDRLEMRRKLSAKPEVVFRVWTEPDHMRNWFAPSAEFSHPFIEVDLRVGGRFRVAFRSPTGEVNVLTGEFVTVDAPNKLVYTWRWEPPDRNAESDTLVTVEFLSIEDGTEVVLTHERFPDAEMQERHQWGWAGALDRLPGAVSQYIR